MINADAVNADV